jgi:hypothetical protein
MAVLPRKAEVPYSPKQYSGFRSGAVIHWLESTGGITGQGLYLKSVLEFIIIMGLFI